MQNDNHNFFAGNFNHGHNILRLFGLLPNFPFTTSKTKSIISNKPGIYELSNKLPNNLRLRKLGNIRKI